jgi:hypothetical protein
LVTSTGCPHLAPPWLTGKVPCMCNCWTLTLAALWHFLHFKCMQHHHIIWMRLQKMQCSMDWHDARKICIALQLEYSRHAYSLCARHMQSGIFILKTCIQTVCKAQAIGYIHTETCIKTVCKVQATRSSYTQDVHIEFVQGTCHWL